MCRHRDDRPVRIEPYDPDWPERFEQERAALKDLLGTDITGGIHHIGSTSVPGLGAKPIIDILVGLKDLETARSYIEPLKTLNYMYTPYRAGTEVWFCKPHPARRTHHLHLVPAGSERLRADLAFRDYLRLHPEVAEEYLTLKRRLAAEFGPDREAYTQAKAEFVRSIVDRSS